MCTRFDLSCQTLGPPQPMANFFIDNLGLYYELRISWITYTSQFLFPTQARQQVAPKALAPHAAWDKGSKEIAGLMLMTIAPSDCAKFSLLQTVRSYVLKMKRYIDILECLGYPISLNLGGSKKLKPGALSLYMGNGQRTTIEAIGSFHLSP
ncbi:hypothetical protein Tco_1269584 [Tanacetum coccineum]